MNAKPKTNDEKRQDLDEKYMEAHCQVMHYLGEIQERVHDLPAPETDELNWAHLGDMNKIKNDLRDIVRFLAGDEA